MAYENQAIVDGCPKYLDQMILYFDITFPSGQQPTPTKNTFIDRDASATDPVVASIESTIRKIPGQLSDLPYILRISDLSGLSKLSDIRSMA